MTPALYLRVLVVNFYFLKFYSLVKKKKKKKKLSMLYIFINFMSIYLYITYLYDVYI